MIQRGKIKLSRTGLYMAYPTTSELKPIANGYQTMVNDQHTNIGMTTVSFSDRKQGYLDTFDGEVEFIPLVEVPADQVKQLRDEILLELGKRFTRAGNSTQWFETNQRDEFSRIALQTVNQKF